MEEAIRRNRELFTFLTELLGDEVEALLAWAKQKLPPVIRVNTLKIEVPALRSRLEAQGFELEPIPFYPEAFRVRHAPVEVGKTLEHFLGYYYVQDTASMLPPLVLNPQPGERVLDIAAAPGSKTTQMAQMMRNTGLIVANDVDVERIRALASNLDRLGVLNTVVTETDGYKLGFEQENFFDRVLLDAPCSAIGTLHKAYEITRWWAWTKVGMLVRTQKGLILAAYRALRPGGLMVYSTCTLVPEENEGVVRFLLERHPEAQLLEPPDFGLRMRPGLLEWKRNRYPEAVARTRRIYPYENEMEGFYIALIRKPEG